MGGCCSTATDEPVDTPQEYGHRVKKWHRPKWRSDQPMTAEELERQREVFWDTEPHYGGSREIWDALKVGHSLCGGCKAHKGARRRRCSHSAHP